ncbi:hypothetical protein B6S12_01355 [Helicobacter valdiviensis]|uniref:Uncharacterized protein n=1 Tax=Helicobacter valdiviensis TaxID=1458358 RepID=A0A2W6MY22_9HELI|nr:hypothetical protein [Helicobacter valdiviensis]PZT48969.1 hypothetical protein B6S12_01355 [Helicobacter valdiviensis]
MFCPECHLAELYFVSSVNTPHLRTKRNSSHNADCYYNYEPVSNQVAQDFIKTLNDKQIQDKLDSIMRYLCHKNNTQAISQGNSTTINPLSIEHHHSQDNIRTMQVLKKKSLNSFFSLEDIGNIYAFYGKVTLNLLIGNKEAHQYAYLRLYINGKKKFQIYFKNNIPNDIDNNAMYNIVIIGSINTHKQDEEFLLPFKIKLLQSNCIKYEKL